MSLDNVILSCLLSLLYCLMRHKSPGYCYYVCCSNIKRSGSEACVSSKMVQVTYVPLRNGYVCSVYRDVKQGHSVYMFDGSKGISVSQTRIRGTSLGFLREIVE